MKSRLTIDGLSFESAHHLNNYDGPCARLHGHSYKLSVTVEGKIDDNGFIVDFKKLKQLVRYNICDLYDHRYLNEMFDFNPTAEDMALFFFNKLTTILFKECGVTLVSLKLWETEHNCVEILKE